MGKVSPNAVDGQSDAWFQVALVDAAGKTDSYVGYRFQQAGALAAAQSWNALPDSVRGGLVAVVRPFDATAYTPETRSLEAIRDLAQDALDEAGIADDTDDGAADADEVDDSTRRLAITTGRAHLYILPTFCSDDDLDFYRDLLADAEAVDIVTDCGECRSNPTEVERAPSVASNAPNAAGDSVVDLPTENAAASIVAYDLEREAGKIKAQCVQAAFRRHWAQVERSIELIEDAADIGMVARSLAAVCEVLNGQDGFTSGADGEWSNDELAAALGFEVEKAGAA